MNTLLKSFLPFGLTVAILASARADEAADEAKAILEKTNAFYRSLASFQVTCDLTVTLGGDGENAQPMEKLHQELRVQRPGSLALLSVGGGGLLGAPNAYLSAGKAQLQIPGEGVIKVDDVKTVSDFFLDERLGYNPAVKGNAILDQNLGLSFFNKIAFAEIGKDWLVDVPAMRKIGEEVIGGTKAHHLTLRTESTREKGAAPLIMDIDVWIAKGDQPLLLQLKPDMDAFFKAMNAASGDDSADVSLSMLATWTGWQINPNLAETSFQAPEWKDELVYETFAGLLRAQDQLNAPAMDLLGAEAPKTVVPLLGKKEPFDLGKEKGKVVILMFWATWDPNGLDALVATHQLVKELDNNSVLFLAVNVGEDEPKAEAYRKAHSLDIMIGFDKDLALAESYRAERVPHTVMIGTDGQVKHVHVGFGDEFKKVFFEELAELIAEEPEK